MGKVDYCVLIGRFQPVHNGHLQVIKSALFGKSEQLIIVLGSVRSAKSIKNPWTYEERVEMLESSIEAKYKDRVHYVGVRDYTYDNNTWVASVQSAVSSVAPAGSSISLIGHEKDESSFYQDLFPFWGKVSAPNYGNIDATMIRTEMFETTGFNPCFTSPGVGEILVKYSTTDAFKELVDDYNFAKGYKWAWKSAPYAPTFVTSDAVVVHKGNVLMIKRGRRPGKGMYALPGGFLNSGESITNSCLRELKEETGIVYPREDLIESLKDVHVFDNPGRDIRGRVITHAHYFRLSGVQLPVVSRTGGDDASEAYWLPIADLSSVETNIYSDHLHIINYFLRRN